MRIMLVALITACATTPTSPPAAPATKVAKPAADTERFDFKVRADFFDGLRGDPAALDRAMAVCEAALAKNPRDAEAMVWHGAGLMARSSFAFRGNDREHGMQLYGDGLAQMDAAVALAPHNVTKSAEVARLIDETRSAFGGPIDILVNNAGGLVARKSIAEMDEGFFDQVMDLNFKSLFLVTKAAMPHLSDGGTIVNLASLAARDGGGPGGAVYAAAKGAVLTLTRGLSKELAPRKIRVNAVSPGLIDTTFHDLHTKPEARKATAARTSIGREGHPDDVANAVLFLASDASAYITGESIEINGGLYFV